MATEEAPAPPLADTSAGTPGSVPAGALPPAPAGLTATLPTGAAAALPAGVSTSLPTTPALTAVHRRRLREVWRSAGWPYQDLIEVELLAIGLLSRERDGHGRETVRVTDTGIALLAHTLQRNRATRDAHEALVGRIAREMQRAGRIVWRGLSLRARVGEGDAAAWVMAMPDVYSVRYTSVEDYLEPVVHEIKVRRADLLSDLRKPLKGEAYRQIGGQCWYVLREGIGDADDVPPCYGVMLAHDSGAVEVQRPAPARAMKLPFGIWMALARAAPEPFEGDEQAGW